jgi:rhamnose utilization protein RhaD (predicted bifunctional aldolase and dehydrogenase)
VSDSRPWPEVLDLVSSRIGKSRDLVQGPGGNTSWKRDGVMWVKASGTRLANAVEQKIFCKIHIDKPNLDLDINGLRPSIETALHSIRKETYVIHVHSVGAMSLGFRKTLNDEVMNLLERFSLGIVDYFRPGLVLSSALQSVIGNKEGLRGALLRNHGLVLWGEDLENLYETLLNFEKESSIMFPADIERLNKIRSHSLEQYLNHQYLTPDHAVFGPSMTKLSKLDNTSWLNDLKYAIEKAVSCVESVEMMNFINHDEVNELQNWESEKLRQGMNL